MTASSILPTPVANPTPRQTSKTVISFGSRMLVRNLTSEAAAKMPKARAALSATIIISAEATTASRIWVCATYGLRCMTGTSLRGRNASSEVKSAASASRKVMRAAIATKPSSGRLPFVCETGIPGICESLAGGVAGWVAVCVGAVATGGVCSGAADFVVVVREKIK